jgi:ABC-type Fe3+ transport system permease subunit
VLTLLGIGLTGAAATAFTVAFAGLAFGIVVAVATVAAVVVRRRKSNGSRCVDDGSSSAAGPVPVQLLSTRPE